MACFSTEGFKTMSSKITLDASTRLIFSVQTLIEASNTLTLLDRSLKALIEVWRCFIMFILYYL